MRENIGGVNLSLSSRILISIMLLIFISTIFIIGYMQNWFVGSISLWNTLWPGLLFVCGLGLVFLFADYHESVQIRITGLFCIVISIFRTLFNFGSVNSSVWFWVWVISVGIIAISLVFVRFKNLDLKLDFEHDL